jgi:hypothetical protein
MGMRILRRAHVKIHVKMQHAVLRNAKGESLGCINKGMRTGIRKNEI